MMASSTSLEQDILMTVEVYDPDRQTSVLLEGVRRSATAGEIRTRALNELLLPADVDWNLRDERTGRLLQEKQRLEEFAPIGSPHVELTMQPDAGLG
jgi:hypothetical protein